MGLSEPELWLLVALLGEAIDPMLSEVWAMLDPTGYDGAVFSVDSGLEFVGRTGTDKLFYIGLGDDLRILSDKLVAYGYRSDESPIERLRNGVALTKDGFRRLMADSLQAA